MTRCIPTGDDCLQKPAFVRLHKRHQIDIPSDANDQYLLPRIPFLIRVFVNVQKISALNVHDDLLETETPLNSELIILLRIPLVVIHGPMVLQRVPYGNRFLLPKPMVIV